MAAFGTFFIVILLMIVNAFINGWVFMMGYELGVVPLINYLGVAPAIPYIYFVLLALAWTLWKPKRIDDESNTKVTETKFWAKYIGVVCTDLLMVGILWVFNLILIG